ncbi:hypothetical protein DFA_06380 [Cavenderia fasciculata]|uniref:Uncharacterized protein n=1 Tax=Cavenderia fasciculata TaxID=261658 RepID=F4PKV8_CACFS|nr:uncharacterized protein DFA_06380 [Cavenderia fasciculata]EGG24232.1 hypothetical protein DFA_06380 [Cavenderia fasciculata]|eukprot:XP_004362083.1 hypothetical protein DFA_06380 [Cavenderia fasciculata]
MIIQCIQYGRREILFDIIDDVGDSLLSYLKASNEPIKLKVEGNLKNQIIDNIIVDLAKKLSIPQFKEIFLRGSSTQFLFYYMDSLIAILEKEIFHRIYSDKFSDYIDILEHFTDEQIHIRYQSLVQYEEKYHKKIKMTDTTLKSYFSHPPNTDLYTTTLWYKAMFIHNYSVNLNFIILYLLDGCGFSSICQYGRLELVQQSLKILKQHPRGFVEHYPKVQRINFLSKDIEVLEFLRTEVFSFDSLLNHDPDKIDLSPIDISDINLDFRVIKFFADNARFLSILFKVTNAVLISLLWDIT